MHAHLPSRRLSLAVVALVGVVACAVIAGSARADNQPPVVSVGPASDPNGSVTASGTAGSGGQTDACLNNQHSSANPSSANTQGAASVNDSTCQKGSGSTNGAGASGGAQTAGNGRTVSSTGSAASSAGAQGASTNRNAATSSVSRAGKAAATVAAVDAHGIQIVRVKYVKTQVATRRLLRLYVTVRDIDHRLVRDAIVSVKPLPNARQTIRVTLATFSNKLGRASLAVPLTTQMLGKRLRFLIQARTPNAHALELGSVSIPARTIA
jgi:hypothetical protein